MNRRWRKVTNGFPIALLWGLAVVVGGCSLGPRALERTRLPYNEALKVTAEEQLLLNIVRLRYSDTPSSLGVSAIAAQFEVQKSLQLTPFFTASGAGDGSAIRSFTSVLPQIQGTAADRPTITMTPLDDGEFTRRLFTPLTLEATLYLAKTTWPISTVFRLYLENLNWVPNAQNASGPTPRFKPTFEDFLQGVELLQVLQNRGQVVFGVEERSEKLGGPVPAASVTARDVAEAAKNGQEYRPDEKGGTWSLVRKTQQPVLHVHPEALASPEMQEFVRIFHLKSGLTKYDVTLESLNPFPVNYPPEGVPTLDLETRSLLQALYFVSHGVQIPPEHVMCGRAPMTFDEDGQVFDWQEVTRGLFKVCWAKSKKRPANAYVAVCFHGYWFYIDERDQDTKSTFSLMLELSRLELTVKSGPAPLLTLPLGAR